MRVRAVTSAAAAVGSLLLLATIGPGTARAAPARPEPDGAAALDAGAGDLHDEKKAPGVGDHVELSTGFIGGARSYRGTSFAFRGGAAAEELAGAGGLVEPFGAYPFSGVHVTGVRWDFRAVVSHVRMTIGFCLPFATFSPQRASAEYQVAGATRQIAAQALHPYELRFGLGGEWAFGRVALFADLLGDVHWVRTSLSVDGKAASYGATSFAFSAGGGVRVSVKAGFFLGAAGEAGLYGDVVWGAQVLFGYVIDV